jgi:hypothetical protein
MVVLYRAYVYVRQAHHIRGCDFVLRLCICMTSSSHFKDVTNGFVLSGEEKCRSNEYTTKDFFIFFCGLIIPSHTVIVAFCLQFF